jgi:hypothetical protein
VNKYELEGRVAAAKKLLDQLHTTLTEACNPISDQSAEGRSVLEATRLSTELRDALGPMLGPEAEPEPELGGAWKR